ncbi:MAG: DoxX family protein [Deltaproteobacteria bacterium]|nr:DoxX family protein [Deltaproteobacteria bacterium]MBW2418116.1 DoxX family protein [Deltaproteobacteria bacterium]
MQFLSLRQDMIYALMRIVFGLLFTFHGMQKLFGFFGGAPGEMPAAMLYTAGIIELAGGALVCIGFQTRWAAFLCSGMMAVAYFMAHQSMGLLPIQNGGEKAVLYCWGFLFIAARGDGIWSVGGATGSS